MFDLDGRWFFVSVREDVAVKLNRCVREFEYVNTVAESENTVKATRATLPKPSPNGPSECNMCACVRVFSRWVYMVATSVAIVCSGRTKQIENKPTDRV